MSGPDEDLAPELALDDVLELDAEPEGDTLRDRTMAPGTSIEALLSVQARW